MGGTFGTDCRNALEARCLVVFLDGARMLEENKREVANFTAMPPDAIVGDD